MKKGIAVVGSTTIDKIIQKENVSCFKIGGVTAYSAITYQKHGVPVYIVTNVAHQDKAIIDILSNENIIVCNGRTQKTTHFINDLTQGRRRQLLPVQATPIKTRQIEAVLDRVNCIHLGPLFPLDIEISALNFLSKYDNLIILDVQGYVRSVKNKIVYPVVSPYLTDVLKIAHIVKANEAELNCMLDFYRMNLDDLIAAQNIKEFIVTLGKKGGFIKTSSGDETHFKAAKLTSVVDPTGAGDVFLAAYVARRFMGDHKIDAAGKYAAKIAARQIEGKYISQETLILPSF